MATRIGALPLVRKGRGATPPLDTFKEAARELQAHEDEARRDQRLKTTAKAMLRSGEVRVEAMPQPSLLFAPE
jgi:hypothetical protein